MRRLILTVCCALLPAVLVAQRPVLIRHYALATMDIGILADTVRGVTVVAAPSVISTEGKGSPKITTARFHPDSLVQWLNLVHAYLQAPVQPDEPDGTRWAPRVRAVADAGWLTFGRKIRKHRLHRRHDAHLAGSLYSWRFEMSEPQVDSLLNLLLEAAALSRLTLIDPDPGNLALCDDPDRPVRVAYQPHPIWVGIPGRVAMQFVVDTSGRAEMDTFVALFATHAVMAEAAREVIEQSRFKAAILKDRPVRQLVHQVINWQR